MVHGRSVGVQRCKSESVSNELTGVGARAALHLKNLKACSSTIYRLVKLFTDRGTITNGGYHNKSCLDKSLLLSKTRSSAQNKKMSDAALFLLPLINQVVCMYQDAAGEVYENLKFNVQQQQSQDYTLIL